MNRIHDDDIINELDLSQSFSDESLIGARGGGSIAPHGRSHAPRNPLHEAA
jgi:hypothetical protein